MLLETKKVTKIFGGLHANSDIDFSIDEGEIVAIIGPNGSGKTTFYNVLTGISPATRGQIIFKGKSQVFCDTQTDKLAICILQNRTDQMRFLINTETKGFFPLNEELSTTGSLIDIRDNPI